MFTVSGRRGAEGSLLVGGGGLSVHCQWEEGGRVFTVSGRRGAECSLSVGGGGLSVHCQWEEGG